MLSEMFVNRLVSKVKWEKARDPDWFPERWTLDVAVVAAQSLVFIKSPKTNEALV